MSSSNLVIADNLSHAKAIIEWLKLDKDLWHGNVYGGKMADSYDRIIMARPLEGVREEYLHWIILQLVPRVKSVNRITPLHWSYHEMSYEDVPQIGYAQG